MAVDDKVTLIVGVTGLVGKELAELLAARFDWKVYGIARKPDDGPNVSGRRAYHFIPCDLLDAKDAARELSYLRAITHVFWMRALVIRFHLFSLQTIRVTLLFFRASGATDKLDENLPGNDTGFRRMPARRNLNSSRVCCFSAQGDRQEECNHQEGRLRRPSKTLLIEKYGNGTIKRYILGSDSQLQTFLEEQTPISTGSHGENPYTKLSWLPSVLKEFILPAGFPESVSEDYLDYMILQFPTNVTAWICHTMVTSSLLKAVGVGSFSGTTAAASAAAIRWVSKDGLGAVGRLFIGGRFGNLFDDDPKLWRLYADFIGSAGSIFELTTPLYPAYFLPLASLGNLAKAIARGLKDPSFRVIQNHFATTGNLGDVAAKEEVWEVAAQLLGLSLGILVMDTPGIQSSYSLLAFTWLSVRFCHLWWRYQSLSVLRFNTINMKRARILVKSHLLHSSVPGYINCNKEENILSWERFSKPRIVFGVPVEEMIGRNSSSCKVRLLLKLYAQEKHILVMRQQQPSGDVEFSVSFKVGATNLSVLRSVWQAFWLHQHCHRLDNSDSVKIEESLSQLEARFSDFLLQLEASGWNTYQIKLKVPNVLIEETEAAWLDNSQ
ncbi:protein root UVB sensitive 5 [Aristolochia californica]|uniref:protein root UVB sensitive 5 n=1 Tax=Aristolochia californica TaxID=171875 RepID=UPI0035D740F0